MHSDVAKYRGERADTKLIVIGNRDVVLCWCIAGKADVAAGCRVTR
jgi:hypothetical protein